MEQVNTHILIDAPIAAVFQQLTSVGDNNRWMKSVTSTTVANGLTIDEGVEFSESGGFLGVTVTDEKIVTQFNPPHAFGFAGQFISNTALYRLETVDQAQTKLFATLTAKPPKGLPALVRKQIMRRTKQRMDDDLRRLKELIESEQ